MYFIWVIELDVSQKPPDKIVASEALQLLFDLGALLPVVRFFLSFLRFDFSQCFR